MSSGNQYQDVNPERHTFDRLIEHVTSELQNRDGYYMPFAFTPPTTPSWTDYETRHMGNNLGSEPYRPLIGMPWSYGETNGTYEQSVYAPRDMLYDFNGSTDVYPKPVPLEQNTVPQNTTHVEVQNIVGNWSPTISNTFSPYGSQAVPEDVKPEQKHQKLSYSDVLSRSPPPIMTESVTPTVPVKPRPVSGKLKMTRKSSLSRQHSSSSDEQLAKTKLRRDSLESQQQKDLPPAAENEMKRKVKLSKTSKSNRNCEFQTVPSSLGKNDSQSKGKTSKSGWEKCGEKQKTNSGAKPDLTFLNNDKNFANSQPKQPPQKSPSYINNNLKANGPEKNISRDKNFQPSEKHGSSGVNCVKAENKGTTKSGKNTSLNCSSNSDLPRMDNKVVKEPILRKSRPRRKEGETYLLMTVLQLALLYFHRWGCMAVVAILWLFHLLYDVVTMSSRLLGQMCLGTWDWFWVKMLHWFSKVSSWVLKWWHNFTRWWKSKPIPKSIACGLECNITLPTTGEEALKRLLSCKGKDSYSILGVTENCTDEDIKKYYKRQAFLVHPDKNQQPGAEEAFKILAHAFELIGEPERRKQYDQRLAERHQMEQAWDELSDLLDQLHKKMEEVANTIKCTNCNNRHRRIKTERPCYAARYCAQCKIHHAAREGDIWAESSILGFLWHYYACMEGAVYDITDWAACQVDNLKHLQANSHAVQYRIVLGRRQTSHPRQHTAQYPSDTDLEDILSNLYSGSWGENSPSQNGSAQNRHQHHEPPRRSKGKKRK